MRPLILAAVLVLAAATPAAAQRVAARFMVDSVSDSTIVFRIARMGWVKPGTVGIAVDPTKRDALVARFRILNVGERHATALITGQTTFVTTDHVALVDEPPSRFFRERSFWTGTVLGGLLGALAALSF